MITSRRLSAFLLALPLYALSLAFLWAELDAARQLFACLLALPLLWLTAEDAATTLLPDTGLWLIAALGLLHGVSIGTPLMPTLVSALAVLTVFWLLGAAYWRWRGAEGLGIGDAKLMAAAVLVVGFADFWRVVFLAALGGIVALALGRARGHPPGEGLPFGPFLAYAIFLTFLLGS